MCDSCGCPPCEPCDTLVEDGVCSGCGEEPTDCTCEPLDEEFNYEEEEEDFENDEDYDEEEDDDYEDEEEDYDEEEDNDRDW